MTRSSAQGGQGQKAEEKQREQQRKQYQKQEQEAIQAAPPPYEVPETPLERLGPGFAYMAAWVGGAALLNVLLLGVIASRAGG